jgi:hypothetical protein
MNNNKNRKIQYCMKKKNSIDSKFKEMNDLNNRIIINNNNNNKLISNKI